MASASVNPIVASVQYLTKRHLPAQEAADKKGINISQGSNMAIYLCVLSDRFSPNEFHDRKFSGLGGAGRMPRRRLI